MTKGLERAPLKEATGTGKPRTPEQLAAGQRNFACFQLKGWRGNLHFVRGQVPEVLYQTLAKAMEDCLHELKGEHVEPSKPAHPTLENWFLIGSAGNHRLSGAVHGHARRDLSDGDIVTTSRLLAYNPVTKVATTATGTNYCLGKPHASYPGDAFKAIAEAKLAEFHQPKGD